MITWATAKWKAGVGRRPESPRGGTGPNETEPFRVHNRRKCVDDRGCVRNGPDWL